jgi:hypothetical protein
MYSKMAIPWVARVGMSLCASSIFIPQDPLLLTAVFGFITASAILLLNLLIAQLNCALVAPNIFEKSLDDP